MRGTLFGVGVGPGDPELFTLKAVRVLSNCPVIAYPAPENGESLVRRIASSYIPSDRVEIIIRTPMIPGSFPANNVYDHYSREIRKHLENGCDVAVLCEGDPFLYGSFSYLFLRLSKDFVARIIPGVSSLSACSSVAGVPLALRNQSLLVVPATLKKRDLRKKILQVESVAIMKVGRHFKKIRDLLRELELSGSAYYIEYASMEHEKVLRLEEKKGRVAPYFSMILVYKWE